MPSVFILTILLSFTQPAHALDVSRCGPQDASEPVVYRNEFAGMYDMERMASHFAEFYESGRRLKGRAYYDKDLGSYVLKHHTGPIKIDENFIQSVTRHIEISLERRYADFIFFPDMGHAHLHIPTEDYKRLVEVRPQSKMYEGFYAYRGLKMLYHTAEKLQILEGDGLMGRFPQDPILLWRYFARNPVGDNNGGENVFIPFQLEEPNKYNTVKKIPGHTEYSAGFDISASKDGCFPYQKDGKTFYFDITMESMPCKDCY